MSTTIDLTTGPWPNPNTLVTSGVTDVLLPDATGSGNLLTIVTTNSFITTLSVKSGANQLPKVGLLGVLSLVASLASLASLGCCITVADLGPGQWTVVATVGTWA